MKSFFTIFSAIIMAVAFSSVSLADGHGKHAPPVAGTHDRSGGNTHESPATAAGGGEAYTECQNLNLEIETLSKAIEERAKSRGTSAQSPGEITTEGNLDALKSDYNLNC